MNIIIFDNNEEDCRRLKELIQQLFQKLKIEYSLEISNHYDFLIDNIMNIDILFLDIELDSMNGIEVGKIVKKANPRCCIIISSHFKKYLIDGYKIHAKRYFLKPINKNEFNIEMSIIIKEYFKQSFQIYDKKVCSFPISIKDILYIEALDKVSILNMANKKKIKTPFPLKYWITRLNDFNFVQSHKSFLVNLSYVRALKQLDVILLTDQLVPLSRNYRKTFEVAYIESLYD